MKKPIPTFLALPFVLAIAFASCSFAETRSAQDMAKECRVALDLFQDRVEKTFENTLFAGECIGYVQGAGDVSLAMADNVKWFKVCVPDSASTMTLIQKFISFVDKNPKYTLASTAFQLMLSQEFACKR
jgi:hypothetical protein